MKGIHNGARLYVVDPRRTSSAQWADVWLGLHVGSDIALANAMAREIIHAGLENKTLIERGTTGFEEYKAAVEPYTLEYGERVSGVPAGSDFATSFTTTPSSGTDSASGSVSI